MMEVIKGLDSEIKPFFELHNGKIRCTLTGHEMPAEAATVAAHAGGKKFRRAVSQRRSQLLLSDNGRFLIDAAAVDGSRAGQLFCKLTCRFVGADAAGIERHVGGKRFRRALSLYEAARRDGEEFVPATSLYRRFKRKLADHAGDGAEVDEDDDEDEEEEKEEKEEEEEEDAGEDDEGVDDDVDMEEAAAVAADGHEEECPSKLSAPKRKAVVNRSSVTPAKKKKNRS